MFLRLTEPFPVAGGELPDATSLRRARPRSGARLAAVGHALAPHRYEQSEVIGAIKRIWGRQHHNPDRIDRFHQAVRVGGRNLALPLPEYENLSTFSAANDAFIRVGTEIGAHALSNALGAAGLEPTDVDAIFFTTVTGLAVPTIDARLVNQLGMRKDVKRIPLFGLGCVGGAAGVARMHDYLCAFPEHVAVLLSVELCSLTLQQEDLSVANLIATGLFGDGAVAVVATGAHRHLPPPTDDLDADGGDALLGGIAANDDLERIGAIAADDEAHSPYVVDTRSCFFPDTEYIMGWDVGDNGFKVVLSDLPALIEDALAGEVEAFLAEHELTIEDIDTWICHPGGPKVLQSVTSALALPEGALRRSWESLERIGNLSSASVLLVLEQTLRERPPSGHGHGLLMAMGPGFCAEMVLLSW